MINSAIFTRLGDDETFTFNDANIPADSITTEVTWRQDHQDRARNFGAYEATPFLGTRVTRFEGDILGTSYTDYRQKRMLLQQIADPQPGKTYLGTLLLDVDGVSMQSNVSLDGYPELPLDTSIGPTAGRYQIAFKSTDPYLYAPSAWTHNSWPKDTNFPIDSYTGNGYSRKMLLRLLAPLSTSAGAADATFTLTIGNPASPRSTLSLSINLATSDYLDIDIYNRKLTWWDNSLATFFDVSNYTMTNWDEFYIHSTSWNPANYNDTFKWTTNSTAAATSINFSWYDAFLI